MDLEELAMMLDGFSNNDVTEEEFLEAQSKSKLLGNALSQEQQLTLYGLYKQITMGNNVTDKPSDIVAEYKWYYFTLLM